MIVCVGLIGLRVLIIAVDNLLDLISCSGRITEDGIDGAVRCTRCVNPAVLHVALASLRHAGTGERASDTEVVDIAAEVVEQRVVESADGMSVAVQRAAEALALGVGDGCPLGVAVVLVGVEEELQVLTASHLLAGAGEIQRHVAIKGTIAITADGNRIAIGILALHVGQVDEVPEQVEAVLRRARVIGSVVVDIDLRLVVHVLVVDVVVVLCVTHHLGQVVEVGHADLHRVRV